MESGWTIGWPRPRPASGGCFPPAGAPTWAGGAGRGRGATRRAFTAIDGGASSRAAQIEEVRGYAGSDLLCYFADAPPSLVVEEDARWGPMLDWAQAAFDLQFRRAVGVMHQAQPSETTDRVAARARAADAIAQAGLAFGVGLFGSAILALAVQRGRLSGDEAFDLSRLDEAYQERLWGVDAEAAQRTARLRGEADLLHRWFAAMAPEREA